MAALGERPSHTEWSPGLRPAGATPLCSYSFAVRHLRHGRPERRLRLGLRWVDAESERGSDLTAVFQQELTGCQCQWPVSEAGKPSPIWLG